VGAGAAGLTCAWLLGPEHEVVCYEALPAAGGNGRNEEVEVNGRLFTVSPGASFFPPAMNRLVLKLMRLVGTPLVPLPTQFTVCDEEGKVRFASPSLRPPRLSPLRRPGAASDLLNWTKLLLAGRRLERTGDWLTPWGEFRAGLGLAPRFIAEVADPVVASLWGVTGTQALGLSARAGIAPALPQQPVARPAQQRPYAVAGGTGTWLRLLGDNAQVAALVTGCPVRRVTADGADGFMVLTDGRVDRFDQVVLAVPPWEAATLAPDLLAGAEAGGGAVAALSALPETSCRIAIHSDESALPSAPGDRSHVTMVRGHDRCQLTTLTGEVSGRPVYRSWVTWSDRMPEPCHAIFEFSHVRPDPVLFRVQARLAQWEERSGLRFAGSWTNGWDCHETAVRSGIKAASLIDPALRRLSLLQGRS
jgi:uncharacterized protein